MTLIPLVVIIPGRVQLDHVVVLFGVFEQLPNCFTAEVTKLWWQSQDPQPHFCLFLVVLFPQSGTSEHWWANNNGWKLSSLPAQLSDHYQRNVWQQWYSIWDDQGQHWVRKEAPHTSPVVLWRMRDIPDRGKESRMLYKSLPRLEHFYLKYCSRLKELKKESPWLIMTSIFPFRNRACTANGR